MLVITIASWLPSWCPAEIMSSCCCHTSLLSVGVGSRSLQCSSGLSSSTSWRLVPGEKLVMNLLFWHVLVIGTLRFSLVLGSHGFSLSKYTTRCFFFLCVSCIQYTISEIFLITQYGPTQGQCSLHEFLFGTTGLHSHTKLSTWNGLPWIFWS